LRKSVEVAMKSTDSVYLDKKLSIIINYIKSVKGIEYVELFNDAKKAILNIMEEAEEIRS
jgi:hypothetical protein